jgi:hypothetical protein
MRTWFVCEMIFPPIVALAAATVMARREGGFRREHLLRALMVFGLAVGTTTHVLMLLHSSWAASTSTAHDSFWTALAVVDPVIAIAIVFAPRAGLVAAIALMICDVAVNATVSGGFADWAIWLQSAFGLFVLAATPSCWTRAAPHASALLQIRR